MDAPFTLLTLRCTLTIDGHTYTAEKPIEPATWEAMREDPPFLDAVKSQLRRQVVEAIVQELDPPVTVHVPPTEPS